MAEINKKIKGRLESLMIESISSLFYQIPDLTRFFLVPDETLLPFSRIPELLLASHVAAPLRGRL